MPALRACAAVACQSSGWFRRREVSSHARSRRAPVTGGGPARRRRWREVQEHNGVRGLPPHPDDAIGPRSPSMIHDSCAASWPGSCVLIAASVSTARPGSQESLSSSVTGSPIRRAGTVGEAHCSRSLPCAAGRHCGGDSGDGVRPAHGGSWPGRPQWRACDVDGAVALGCAVYQRPAFVLRTLKAGGGRAHGDVRMAVWPAGQGVAGFACDVGRLDRSRRRQSCRLGRRVSRCSR
jgi:hypothetical protein